MLTNVLLSCCLIFTVNLKLTQADGDYHEAWNRLENFTQFSLNNLAESYENELKYIFDSGSISNECKNSLKRWILGLKLMDVTAVKRLDSWGSLPSGILDGSWIDMGAFSQCMSSTANRYCLLFGNMPLMEPHPIEGITHAYSPKYFNFSTPVFNSFKPYIHYLRYLNVTTGICMPRECSRHEIKGMAQNISDHRRAGLKIDVDMCQTREPHNPITLAEAISLTLVATVLALNIAGIFAPESSFLYNFNFIQNFAKLFKTRKAGSNGGITIPSLDGIKALTMLLMLYIHVFFAFLFQNMISMFRSTELVTQPTFSVTLMGPFTMETFFLLTGLETTIHFLHNHKKLSGGVFLFLRWTRFVPCIAWMIACYILFFSIHVRDFIGGPLWTYYHATGSIAKTCEKTWLGHLFMVAHYFEVKEDINICLLADWYLEADYMFAILFVLLVLPFIKRSRKSLATLNTAAMILIGAVILGLLMHIFDLQHSWLPMAYPQQKLMTYLVYIHSKGWGHLSSYFVGVLTGLIMEAYRPKISKVSSYILWTLWFGAWTILIVYEVGMNYALLSIPYSLSLLYGMFSKVIWSYVIAWLVYACHHGHIHPFVPKFLSAKVFSILSRVNLSALFINPMVFRLRNATFHTSVNLDLIDFTFSIVLPLLTIIYALAFLFCALIEVPSVNIMKSLLIKENQRPERTSSGKPEIPLVDRGQAN